MLLTGSPGVGKTTVLLKAVEALKAKGYGVGGMVSREVRACGSRVGFEIFDLSSSKRGWLAHVDQKTGPQVGKYRVNMEDLDEIGAEAIEKAVEDSDVVTVDEIGPMELFSKRFRMTVEEALESGKLMLGVVHWKAKDKLIDEVKKREDTEIIVVTLQNRDRLYQTIAEVAMKFLSEK